MLITLPNALGNAATNMAIDAALLQTLPDGVAAFRHYGWTEPAITFGYSQRFNDVLETSPEGATLCRRMTGGGIVDHRNDWTYALILQSKIPAAHIPATELYKNIHRSLAASLKAQSIDCQLAPCPHKCPAPDIEPQAKHKTPDASVCFTQPAADDVMGHDDQKLAGAALKRNRHGLLLEGSLARSALPATFEPEVFRADFVRRLSQILEIPQKQPEDLRWLFDGALIEKERRRFKSDHWNQKR